MLRMRHLLVLCFSLAVFAQVSEAREWCAGLTSSPVGSGIRAQLTNGGGELDIITVVADTYGVVTGRTSDIGIRASYTHDYVLASLRTDGFLMRFHAGAGLMAGYVHDHEGGLFISTDKDLGKGMGLAAALSCSIGLRLDFARNVAIDFGFAANPGVHLRLDEENGSIYLSFYKNGIFHAILPQISIMYRF